MYLLLRNIKFVLLFVKFCGKFTTTLHFVYPHSNKIGVSTTEENKYLYKIMLAIFYLIVTWVNLALSYNRRSVANLVVTIFLVSSMTFHMPIVITVFQKREELATLFNFMLRFEERYKGKNLINYDLKTYLSKVSLNLISD